MKCDVDKWCYFELLGIIKEMGYEESGIVLYRDPTISMFTLSNVNGAQEIVDLWKIHKCVHLYVRHLVSQPDYYDGSEEDETQIIDNVVFNVDEEVVIGKLVEEVLIGKGDGVTYLNMASNEDVVQMTEVKVGGTNVDVMQHVNRVSNYAYL